MPEEPKVTCPKCLHVFAITEAMTAAIEAKLQAKHAQDAAVREQAIAAREQSIVAAEAELARAKSSIEAQVESRLRKERAEIADDEARKARLALESDLTGKDRLIKQLGETISSLNSKLGAAQEAEATLLRKERELNDAKRELELSVEQKVTASLEAVREQARREVEETLKLKVREGELKIAQMAQQIDGLRKKAEEGSGQSQGEAAELELEETLRARFNGDTIEPVPKGQFGGDILHRVVGATGTAGTILWESKRTRNWSDGWMPKLREDKRTAGAEIAIIVTQALPKGIQNFDLVDGVWITAPRFAIPLAVILRQSLIDLADVRVAGENRHTKMDLVYAYLTGPRFKAHVESLVEHFTEMQDGLRKERKWVTAKWAEREKQLELMLLATASMYGDIRGIAGRSLPAVEGLSLPPIDPQEDARRLDA